MKLILGPILYARSSTDAQWSFGLALMVDEAITGKIPLNLKWSSKSVKQSKPYIAASYENNSFIRWDIDIPRAKLGKRLSYEISSAKDVTGLPLEIDNLAVPGTTEDLRIAFFSCNGIDDPKIASQMINRGLDLDDLWNQMYADHQDENRDQARHLLVGGGDQIYADCIWQISKLKKLTTWKKRRRFSPTEHTRKSISDHYFNLYIDRWKSSTFSDLLARIPSVMTWDDHDIFDGWGSYDAELQDCPLFRMIFESAKEQFRIFQVGGTQESGANSSAKNNLIGDRDNHSLQALSIGENLDILLLDSRSNRTAAQVLSDQQMQDITEWLYRSNNESRFKTDKQLIIVSSIPLVHLDFAIARTVLDWVPFRQELEDDILDQWEAGPHRGERSKLIMRLLKFSADTNTRVTIVSGDVHVGARAKIRSERKEHERPRANVNAIHQLTASGIVYPPESSKTLWLMEKAFAGGTEELTSGVTTEMLKVHSGYLLGQRNWLSIDLDKERNRLWVQWHTKDGALKQEAQVIHP